MADDPHTLLDQAEEDVASQVSAVLAEVADEFAAQLADATELIAARFSVSRIARAFTNRMPRIVRRLLGVCEQAASHTAEAVDGTLPPGWDDLPGRYDDGRDLPPPMSEYVTVTEHLLRAVGDRLATVARDELATGVAAGEDMDQLRARLRQAFAREGAQLGEVREERIARTEAGRAWNTATLAAARAATGPDRPLVKQWLTRRDNRVRHDHDVADGQLRLLDEPFTVGGIAMSAPHDPAAPAAQTVNCRCVLAVMPELEESALASKTALRDRVSDSKVTAAADGSHRTGAMIALIPTAEDAARLAIEGGEPADELHLTLYFLGQGEEWTADQRRELAANVRARAYEIGGAFRANAFGANHWNGASDEPSWVWAVGDDRDREPHAPTLGFIHALVTEALEDTHERPEVPVQHSPWVPHVCAAYSADPALLQELETRLGPVRFDRLRLAFAGDRIDIPLTPELEEEIMPETSTEAQTLTRAWSTPGDTAIAFEDQETGDGRVFAAGSLYWDADPMPLQHADEMGMGHEGAELCGAIQTVMRDGNRIAAAGVLYTNRRAGQDAITLLEQKAPLGVSVDLDDVDIQFVDKTVEQEDLALVASARLARVSVLRLDDGSVVLSGSTRPSWVASSGTGMVRTRHDVQLITGPDGMVSRDAVRQALAGTGLLTAAAGDPDDPEAGQVIHTERAGDLLVRITRARLRGATLVAMPAYSRARIVLDDAVQAAGIPTDITASSDTHEQVITYVSTSPVPVGARDVAQVLDISVVSARSHLVRAVSAGRLVRLAPGQYVGASTLPEGEVTAALTAAASGDLDLPVHDNPEAEWDGDKARSRVLEWATSDDGTVDADRLGAAFLYRDETADPATADAYKLGFADVFTRDGTPRLEIVARAVYAIASVLDGGMGGVDVPDGERDDLRDRVEDLYERLSEAYDDPSIIPPWSDDEDELEASAWRTMQDLPPMPAEWFTEPTEEELPPGSGGVHYRDGRVYGWVAQAGEPHAGYPGKNLTIDKLAKRGLDLSHFLRAKFRLDDGTYTRAGAMTMNVGHGRDGSHCESAACQFDDTRTVGAIVTVGMNSRGLWFSGAAAPWLSEWDRQVFAACQPSYHLQQGRDGRWQLRAVLTVPVPGHSSPLVAAVAAVTERAQLALAASAAGLFPAPDAGPAPSDPARPAAGPDTPAGTTPAAPGTEQLTAALTAALLDGPFLDTLLDAMTHREAARRAEVEALTDMITASAKGN